MTGASPDGAEAMGRAVVAGVPFLAGGVVVSAGLLVVPWPTTVTVFLAHLAVLVGFALVVSMRLSGFASADWFPWAGWSPFAAALAAGVGVVFLVTGSTALVTLASAAALRMPPSTQFLQLLSALDIAWAMSALIVGLGHLGGRGLAVGGGLLLGAACVWSIGTYLSAVGLGPDGSWIVDGDALFRYVIPFDVMAAFAGSTALIAGAWRSSRQELGGDGGRAANEQASPQS